MKFKEILNRIRSLETIEEKSFWVMAPLIALIGLLGVTTGYLYSSYWPTYISAFLCLVIPALLMVYVHYKPNYHIAYPILCITIGAISIPLTFVFSGGFESGMPLFCVAGTAISAFCYSKKWRHASLILSILGNSFAFAYVYNYGSPNPLTGPNAVKNDILFSYYVLTVTLYASISMIINEIRKYRINQDTLQQYFDIAVRKEILNKAVNGHFSSNSEKRKAVILFADVSSFTTITEKMPVELVSKFLNTFFTIAEKYIHETNGIIDKYIGDCVMAYWIDVEGENSVLKAVQTTIKIKKELYNQAEEIFNEYETELNFSAGISYGDVIFGDIGSDNMHDYTVIGDAVNTASRIEQYAAAGEIYISDSAAAMVKDNVELENVDTNIYFKGKNKYVNLYRVVSLDKEIGNTKIINSTPYGYTIYICGCRGSFPVSGIRFSEYGGETSCYVVKKDDYAVVVDCGTGLKNAISILNDCKNIDILVTHVHYDHILGFLIAKLPENANIRIFGYFKNWSENSNTLIKFMDHPYWPIEIKHTNNIGVELEKEIQLDKDITATFYKSDHPDEACVIKLMCKDKKVCFFADCENPDSLDDDIAKNSDILFYDGMYDDKDEIDHTGWGHGTWQNSVNYAKKENIKHLIVTHHNPENGDHTLLANEYEARSKLNSISFAKTGDRIII